MLLSWGIVVSIQSIIFRRHMYDLYIHIHENVEFVDQRNDFMFLYAFQSWKNISKYIRAEQTIYCS